MPLLTARRGLWALLVTATGLLACAAPETPPPAIGVTQPVRWQEASVAENVGPVLPDPWWQALQDPVLDRLMPLARFTSVEQALARVDEARAQLGQQQAAAQPQLHGALGAQRGTEQNGGLQLVSRAGPSAQLGWELDLWGRLAQGRKAAEQRGVQREADTALAQLMAQAQLVELVQQERACRRSLGLLQADERSWSQALRLQHERLRLGALSEQGLARQEGQAALLRFQLAGTQGQCRSLRQALRALAGVANEMLDETLALESAQWRRPPALQPQQPAALLMRHPQVRSASAAADAAALDVGAARAARLPSLNLAALLAHQWLRVLGQGSEQQPWSGSVSLAGALWDGGAGSARVDAAGARLRLALAGLDQALRQTVREVESALAQQAAAQQQWQAAQQRVLAGEQSWRAAQSAAAAGRMNVIEFEEAARQQRALELAAVAAQRDLDLAWTGVIKSAGLAPLHFESQP